MSVFNGKIMENHLDMEDVLGFSMFFPRGPSAFVQGARVRRAVLEALERPEDG